MGKSFFSVIRNEQVNITDLHQLKTNGVYYNCAFLLHTEHTRFVGCSLINCTFSVSPQRALQSNAVPVVLNQTALHNCRSLSEKVIFTCLKHDVNLDKPVYIKGIPKESIFDVSPMVMYGDRNCIHRQTLVKGIVEACATSHYHTVFWKVKLCFTRDVVELFFPEFLKHEVLSEEVMGRERVYAPAGHGGEADPSGGRPDGGPGARPRGRATVPA